MASSAQEIAVTVGVPAAMAAVGYAVHWWLGREARDAHQVDVMQTADQLWTRIHDLHERIDELSARLHECRRRVRRLRDDE